MPRLGRISYSGAERAWIKAHCHLPRAELHRTFSETFSRADVALDHIKSLCSREKWNRLPPKRQNLYAAAELVFIKNLSNLPRRDIHAQFCAEFNRRDISEKDITNLCASRGWARNTKPKRGPIPYSEGELVWIKSHSHLSRPDLHLAFVREFRRHDVKVDDIKSLCTRRGWSNGRSGYFEKGHVPFNKGRTGYFAPGSEKGWFKKGQTPANQKPMGHERIDAKDGYVYIKIDVVNPHTGFRGRYVHKHRHLWEQLNGPIPDDHCLKCLDSDKTNMDLSNWKLIPRSMLPRLNNQWSRNYEEAPLEIKPAIMAAAELEQKVADIVEASISEGGESGEFSAQTSPLDRETS